MLNIRIFLFLLLVIPLNVCAQGIQWPYNTGYHVDHFGNTFLGQRDNGFFIMCNGVGCPVRG
ncbi:unnamed protein product [Strongylus vulgaris]|uniref:Uncharacterized protein n=1 Tax=Strongylus vulgaris TaxID=40348 RepID=A0A3P7K832_STRVU|nr:unnamed protein product [Strongylus vulgaris]